VANSRRAGAIRALPVVALVVAMFGCTASGNPLRTVGSVPISSASGAPAAFSPQNEPDWVEGQGSVPHPVTDLNLEQLVPPGGVAVTAAPIHGSSPSSPPDLALGRFSHLGGTFSVVFLCAGANAAQVDSTWYSSTGPLPCDPGTDLESRSVAQCQGPGATGPLQQCSGRNWFTFTVPNTALAVMPQFQVPATGVSWTLFAWIAPPSTSATSGVTAGSGRLAGFGGYGLSFSYPRSWHSLVPRQQPGDNLPQTLVFESTAPLRDSCPVSTPAGGGSFGGFPCGRAPVSMLPAGGLLVTWATTGVGIADVTRAPGTPGTLAGQPARVFSGSARSAPLSVADPSQLAGPQTGPSCAQIGGDQVLAALISLGPGSADEMLACFRAPQPAQSLAEVLTMLRSLRLT
jgi:hypothetical protein